MRVTLQDCEGIGHSHVYYLFTVNDFSIDIGANRQKNTAAEWSCIKTGMKV